MSGNVYQRKWFFVRKSLALIAIGPFYHQVCGSEAVFSSALRDWRPPFCFVCRQVPTPARSQNRHRNHKRRRIMPRPRKWLLSRSNWEVSTASGNAHRYEPSPSLSHFSCAPTYSWDAYNKVFLCTNLLCCTERGGWAWRGQRFRGRQHEQCLRLRGIQQPQ